MNKLINEEGLRIDGRKIDEIRPLKIEVGILKNADGSAYIEFGKNKIIAAVFGPKEAHPKHISQPDRMVLRCRYHMAPFSTDTRKSPAPSRREIEISKVIRESLEPVLLVEEYPRTLIDIYVEVLESDGGSRCAGITAAAAALADSGVSMRDMVVACAAGKIDGQIVLDLSDEEDKEGQADMPVALLPNLNLITLLQLDGNLTEDEFHRTFNLALNGCKQIYNVQREALITRHFGKTDRKE
jgi:exosome complex component RRP41